MTPQTGKYLMLAGGLLLLGGLLVYFFGGKLNWIGRLPGDIRIEGKNGVFYFPVMTGILVSILLNLIVRLIRHFFG